MYARRFLPSPHRNSENEKGCVSLLSQEVEEPVLIVEPPRGLLRVDWKELRQYGELLFFLTWRDLKVKYRQTLLGVAWAVLVPFLQMVVFSFVFKKVANLSTSGLPGPVFYYVNLLPWTYFANSLSMSSGSLLMNTSFLTKVYFPRVIIPTVPCLASLLDFSIAFALLGPLLWHFGTPVGAMALFLPALMAIAFIVALGTGFLFSALQVRYRDIRYLLPFITQIWMYCTVIFPFSALREYGWLRYLYALNPMAGVVEGFRWCLFSETIRSAGHVADPPWFLLAVGTPVALAILFAGLFYFKKMERTFADII
jgi:lipopolysaccharide transport system permease protein